jgi:hypothetical protein
MARPKIPIDDHQLRTILRWKPTLVDVAHFFECSPDTIEKYIRDNYDCRFTEFRDQNMVKTRHNLIQTALYKAETGDNCMLIFCLKNLCQWRDRPGEEDNDPFKNMSNDELKAMAKRFLFAEKE